MNIDDVPAEGLFRAAAKLYGTDHPLQIIFLRQRKLMEKYLEVEAEILRRPILTIPVDLHSAIGQAAIKERAWWFVEELAEAVEALEENQRTKAFEEYSDALHFITEAFIVSGISWESSGPISQVPRFWPGFRLSSVALPGRLGWKKLEKLQVLSIIVELGMAMWQLRNKSWKRTQILTDVPRYTDKMIRTYGGLLALLRHTWKMSMEEIVVLYLRKAAVNQFRVRSHY